jgi:hypothetical protein
MANVKIGRIPDSVTYIHAGNACEVSTNWQSINVPISPGVMVIDAYPAPSDNEKVIESGKVWAGYKTKTPVISTRKNDPIAGVRVIMLEKRGEGGRAYKVITPDGFYFDLREDVLLDTMLREGIEKNGVLGGTFIWGYIGSQMKLVRVGSELHNALKVANENSKKVKLSRKDFKIGGVYKSKAGIVKVFLGNVDTVELEDINGNNGTFKRENYMLWYDARSITDILLLEKVITDLKRPAYNVGQCGIHWVVVTKQHSFIEKIGQIVINIDILKTLKERALDECSLYEKAILYDRASYYSYNDKQINIERRYCRMAHILNAQEAGAGYMMHQEYVTRYGHTL